MTSKEDVAIRMALVHYEIEEGLREVYRLHAASGAEAELDEPIKLLEVNENTISAGIMPLGFAADPASGFDYPCAIVEITPDEFEQLKRGEIQLPHGWTVGEPLFGRKEASQVSP
ncbi:MAG TPA: hypothetical protein VND64_05405 [Pirellulales bacterium]|nr:hypothetical protein [Pirellulales bacterium]